MTFVLVLVAFLQGESLDQAARLWGDASAEARDEGTRLALRRWAEWTDQDLARLKVLGDSADPELSSRAREASARIGVRRKLGAPLVLRFPQADATILSKDDVSSLQLLRDVATQWERLALRDEDLEKLASALAGRAWKPDSAQELLHFLRKNTIDEYGALAAGFLKDPERGEQAARTFVDLDPDRWSDAIASMLTSPHVKLRLKGLEVLKGWLCRSKAGAVVPLLEGGTAEVRKAALETLQQMMAVDHAPRIAALLKDRDEAVAAKAAVVLGEIGAHAQREALLEALTDPRESVQDRATDALNYLGLGERPERVAKLLEHRNANIRRNAARLLSRRHFTSPIFPVGDLLRSEDPVLRRIAVSTLRKADTLKAYLRDPDAGVRNAALFRLNDLGAALGAADDIAAVLDDLDDFGAPTALRVLGHPDARRHADKVVPLLAGRRSLPIFTPKEEALQCLARMGAVAHAGAIAALLKDPDPRVQMEAAVALARLRVRTQAGALLDLIRPEAERIPEDEVFVFLGAERRADMIRMIGSEDAKMSMRACASFPSDETGEVLPLLAPLLRSPLVHVRKNVVQLMGRWRDPRTLPYLVPLLKDPEESIRISAAYAVAGPGARDHLDTFLAFLKSESGDRRRVGIALVARTAGMDQASTIASFVTDPDPGARREAIWALGQLGAVEHAGALVARLKDPSLSVRGQAIDSLAEIGSGEHIAAIVPLLGDRRVQSWALHALGQTNAREHGPRVAAMLDDPDPYLRVDAAQVLLGWDPVRWLTPALQVVDLPWQYSGPRVLYALAGMDWTTVDPKSRDQMAATLRKLAEEATPEIREATVLALLSLGDRPLPSLGEFWSYRSSENEALLRALSARHAPDVWSKLRRVEKLDGPLESVKDFTAWLSKRGLTLFRSHRIKWIGRVPEGMEISALQILERMYWKSCPYVEGQTVTLLDHLESRKAWEQRLAK